MATKVKSAREDEALLGLDVSLLLYFFCFMNHPDQLMKVESLGSNKTFHINQVVDVFAQNYSYFTELKYIAFVVPLSSTVFKNLPVEDSFTILRFLQATISGDLYLRGLALQFFLLG